MSGDLGGGGGGGRRTETRDLKLGVGEMERSARREGRSQKPEARSQNSGSWRDGEVSEARSLKPDARSQRRSRSRKPELRSRKPEVGSWLAEGSSQRTEGKPETDLCRVSRSLGLASHGAGPAAGTAPENEQHFPFLLRARARDVDRAREREMTAPATARRDIRFSDIEFLASEFWPPQLPNSPTSATIPASGFWSPSFRVSGLRVSGLRVSGIEFLASEFWPPHVPNSLPSATIPASGLRYRGSHWPLPNSVTIVRFGPGDGPGFPWKTALTGKRLL